MKKIREGYKITEFGEIPEEWNIGSIDELTTFIKSGLSRNLKDENVGIPCIRSNNIVNGRINYNDLKYWFLKDDKGANIEDYILNDGDVLVNFINSMAQIGKTCIYRSNGRDAIYTTNIFRVNFNKDKILNEYFYYFSQTDRYEKEIELITKPAVNQASFTTVDFKKIKLAIPIIKEQERIVSILSTVDEQIDNVDALIEKNKELKKGLMQTLLTKGIGHTKFKKTEIGEIPEEWEVKQLGDIANYINGKAFKPSEWGTEGLPIVRIQNLNGANEYNYYSGIIDDKFIINNGQLLFAWSGSKGTSFGPFIWNSGKAVLNQHIFKVDLNGFVNSIYGYYALKQVTQIIEESAHGSAGLVHVTKGTLEKFKIGIPKVEEQIKIASILSEIDGKIGEHENKKQKLGELKRGLMQQLLTGKIRVI